MNRYMNATDLAAMRKKLRAGGDASIEQANQLVELVRIGDVKHVDDMAFRRDMAAAHSESVTTLDDLLARLPERERSLLHALNETGTGDLVNTMAVMLAKEIRRDAATLMHGSAA